MALDPKDNKGRSPEESEKFGRNRPGVYLHKETGKTMTVTTTPAADAMAMQGWEFQRPATAEDLKPKPAQEDGAPGAEPELRARLKRAERAKEIADKRAANAEEAQKLAEEAAEIAKADTESAEQKAADEAKARKEAEDVAEKAKADADAAQKLAKKTGVQTTIDDKGGN